MRKTINLSRVKAAPRQKRAEKAVTILREAFPKEVKVSRELNQEIWSNGMQNPPNKLTIKEDDGVLYPVADSERASDEDQEEDIDYSEVVSGTIADVKGRVEELEEPDLGALIDAEEKNKDRKTMKEWLESQK